MINMQKIKFIVDSASDIPQEYLEKYDIDMMCFPITVGNRSFNDRDISNHEYYDLIMDAEDLPHHSQLTQFAYADNFKKYYIEGYTDIFYVSIASKGSNTYNSSIMGRDMFFEADPDAKGKVNIRIVDSGNYSGAYGFPVVRAAMKAESGASADEIEGMLNEWYSDTEVHFGVFSLEFVKKSGRVSTAAAFVGEMLGLRPLIMIKHGVSSTLAKVRGDKAVVPKLASIVTDRIVPQSPYVVIQGYDREYADQLEKELTAKLGYPPEMRFEIGGVIAANSGPKMVGVSFRSAKE